MRSRKWFIGGVLGGLAWAGLELGLAHAGPVLPIDATTLKLVASSPVTVSLYQLDSGLPSTVTLQSPSRCITTGTPFYKDVTDCWLPEWNPADGGKSVYVVVVGAIDTPVLVPPALGVSFPLASVAANPFLTSMTTSAYPGQCTNFGSGTAADFTLGAPTTLQTSATTSLVGYELRPTDCGGMAVIQVGGLKFLLPRDGSTTVPANGLPDVWESPYGALDPAADIDTGPVASSLVGDGITTFDEYRGVIVSGKQVRTDPKQKDLFLHVVNPADSVGGVFVTSSGCGASCFGGGTTTYPAPAPTSATLTVPATAATPGAIATFTTSSGVFSTAHVRGEIIGTAGGRARIVSVTGPTGATAQITQAFTPGSVSPASWTLRESLFALVYTLVSPERLHLLGYTSGTTNAPLTSEWVDNFVSLAPAQTLTVSDSVTDRAVNSNRVYGPIQRGVRVMEGLNTNSSSVLGFSFGVASPNDAGNVVVFTQRILNYLNGLMNATGVTTFKYSTASLVNNVWTWSSPLAVDRNFVLSKAFQFYTGHEIQHSLNLTPDVQGTTKTTYGHHFAPGTGDCLDQAITTTSKSGTVTFYIPSICGTADQTQFVIR